MGLKSMIWDSDTTVGSLSDFMVIEREASLPEFSQMDFGRYEIFPTDSMQLFFNFEEKTALPSSILQGATIGMPMPYSIWVNSYLFLLLLIGLFCFAFVFRWEGTALKGSFRSVFTLVNQTSFLRKKQVANTEVWGELYLVVQAILIFSVLLFSLIWGEQLSMLPISQQALSFGVIVFGLAVFIYLKILCYRLIGSFFLKGEMTGWITSYTRMIEMLGIVSFLPIVVYVYLLEARHLVFIGLLVLILISLLVVSIRMLNIFVKNKIHPFYFFVYLCGTEIAPYLLLYKGVLFAITIAGDNII